MCLTVSRFQFFEEKLKPRMVNDECELRVEFFLNGVQRFSFVIWSSRFKFFEEKLKPRKRFSFVSPPKAEALDSYILTLNSHTD